VSVNDATIGARLQTARRAMGLTQTEVGMQLEMVTSTVSAIEAGKRSVSGTELYRFAEIYKRPLAYFLGGEPPSESPGFQYLFRQVDEQILDRPSIVKLEQLAADYQLLEELVGAVPLPLPPDYSTFGFRTTADAETLAEMERSRLSLGDVPIRDLADLLDEQVGARTFMLPVANQSWSGVVVRDGSERPCIAVNSKEEFYRRNYDLGHEYAHALVHLGRRDQPQGRIDVTAELGARQTPEERFADAFAAAFLMPKRAVLEQLERTMRARAGKFTDEDLVHLAMHFGVSGQAMSLRLVSLGKLPRSAHDQYWKQAESFKALAGMLGYEIENSEAFWGAPVILPKRFRYLALKAYQRDIISVSKLAELLREDIFELRGKLEAGHRFPAQIGDAT
jgi:Zn-dependent peptidase ImmA (M78 family)